jgi:hemerythrin-like domain-containing protein
MKSQSKMSLIPSDQVSTNRRVFIRKGLAAGTVVGVSGLAMLSGCGNKQADEITPNEDLMREHGALNRIMLVYDACHSKLVAGESFPAQALYDAAHLIRTFVEDYHEMLEEKYLFPRFVSANKMVVLVQLLFVQHHAGKVLTDQIMNLATDSHIKSQEDAAKLSDLLVRFNGMYRPHEAREDTVLFPAIHGIVTPHEYNAMAEDFEKKEREMLGMDGFATIVNKIENIEKQLGIYDLSQFTPAV